MMTNTQEAFEQWFKTENGFHTDTDLLKLDGKYVYAPAKLSWSVWQACQAHNDAVIAELKTRIGDVTQMYQEKLDERDKTIAELREDLLDLRKQVNYRCADVQRLTELNIELVEALERLDGWLEARHLGGLMPNEKALIAKHKKV